MPTMHYSKHRLPLNLCHLFTVRSDHAYISKKYHDIIIIKLGSRTLLNILWVSRHFHTSLADCNHYQIEQIDWIFWACPFCFSSDWHIRDCAVSNSSIYMISLYATCVRDLGHWSFTLLASPGSVMSENWAMPHLSDDNSILFNTSVYLHSKTKLGVFPIFTL